ncbi:MAG: hypothetical protein WB608_05185 [Terracidiphilus sp.]
MKLPALRWTAILLPLLALLSGCHSPHIDVTVENRTGAPIELLEVDYPSASFGADTLAAGADYHYRIQVRLSGPVKVQYTETASHQVRQMTGPDIFERQEGRLVIELLPGGKAQFHPELTAKR